MESLTVVQQIVLYITIGSTILSALATGLSIYVLVKIDRAKRK